MIDINKEFEGMTWNDVVGSSAARAMAKYGGHMPQVVLFAGPYGCGKNLHAYLIAHELKNPSIHVRNTVDNTAKGAADLIVQYSAPPFVPTVTQVCILNEFTLFRKDAQAKFKDIFDAPPERTFFFVCTHEPEKILKDIYNRFGLKVFVTLLNESDAYELVERTCKKLKVELTKKKKRAIATGSGGRPRTIIKTIKAIAQSGEAKDEFISDMLQVSDDEQHGTFIDIYHYLIQRKYWKGNSTDLRVLVDMTELEPDSIRFKMLHMLYKNYNKQARSLYLALLPPLERGAEKHDLYVRFMRVLNIL